MRLLCTNDDGILALGLDCLVRAAQSLGDVTVVAPDREQSATSHALTMHHPLRVKELKELKPRGERRFVSEFPSSAAARSAWVAGAADAAAEGSSRASGR